MSPSCLPGVMSPMCLTGGGDVPLCLTGFGEFSTAHCVGLSMTGGVSVYNMMDV